MQELCSTPNHLKKKKIMIAIFNDHEVCFLLKIHASAPALIFTAYRLTDDCSVTH